LLKNMEIVTTNKYHKGSMKYGIVIRRLNKKPSNNFIIMNIGGQVQTESDLP